MARSLREGNVPGGARHGEPRILDCGANVGLASLYFKKRYPEARVTAFEADPAIADVLRGNLLRNGCPDVEVVEAAVWTEEGTVEFCREGADSGTIQDFASGTLGGAGDGAERAPEAPSRGRARRLAQARHRGRRGGGAPRLPGGTREYPSAGSRSSRVRRESPDDVKGPRPPEPGRLRLQSRGPFAAPLAPARGVFRESVSRNPSVLVRTLRAWKAPPP